MNLINDIHYMTPLNGCQRVRAYIDDTGMLWLDFSLRDKLIPVLNVSAIGDAQEISAQVGQVFSQELGNTAYFFRQGTSLQMQICILRHKVEVPE